MLKLLDNCYYFTFIMDALHDSLTKLNIPHELVKTIQPNDDVNIYLVCTTHHTGYELPKRYISYNLEQLTTNKYWEPEFFNKLKGAELVLDYSKLNIEELKKYDIHAHFLPIGYAETMEYKLNTQEKPIDIIFLGYMNQNRYRHLFPFIHNKSLNTLIQADGFWVIN